ncbi:hypothetical protein, partial [Treponema endosymbiont of Eucomonympha sp.]|uniref:hypothetical protein n=1 Tax=Treponema endosymbiont of Eucomonympha sp. TaxID=1580831 RepID=UPI000AEDB207
AVAVDSTYGFTSPGGRLARYATTQNAPAYRSVTAVGAYPYYGILAFALRQYHSAGNWAEAPRSTRSVAPLVET